MPDLSVFDWFLVVVVVLSTASGFGRGLVRALFSIAGLTVGVLVATWYYLDVAQNLRPRWISSMEAAEVVAFLLLLIGVVVAFATAAAIVRRMIATVGLGPLDRLLGAAFGALRGCLVAVFLLVSLAAFAPNSSWTKNSLLAPYFLVGAHALSFVVPEHFQKQVADGAVLLRHRAPRYLKSHPLE